MASIDVRKCLPQSLAIKSVDNELYRIGCLCRPIDQTNDYNRGKGRHRIHHPILVNTILVIQVLKSIISLESDDKKLAIYLGDFSKLMDIAVNTHIAFILFTAFNLSIHVIHAYNHIRGVDPSFLRVFQMMSGSLTPIEIGVTDERVIKGLIRRTKRWLTIIKVNCRYLVVVFGIILIIWPYLRLSIIDLIIIGIPNTICSVLWSYYTSITIQMNGFYVHVICHYIKCKIRAINNRIRDSVKLKRRLNIRRMHSNLNSIYTETNEYNEIFFSKYYLSVWLFLGSLNTFLLYIGLFQNIPIIFFIMYLESFLIFFSLFSFLILNASSVNTEANNSYKIFNSLYICYFSSKIQYKTQTSLNAKFKVSLDSNK